MNFIQKTFDRYRTAIILLLIFVVGALLRLPSLRDLPFYFDEQSHTHQAIELLQGRELTYTRAFFPVTVPVMISFYVFGISWFKARIPMLLLNMLAIFPLYHLLKRANKAVAWIGVLLFTIDPWVITAARSVREYAVLPMFLFTAGLIVTELYFHHERKAVWLAAVLFASYLILLDARGFLIFSLVFYFITFGIVITRSDAVAKKPYHKWLWLAGAVLLFLGLAWRIFLAQKQSDIGTALPSLGFTSRYINSFTQSGDSHAYWLPALGWILLLVIVFYTRYWFVKKLNETQFIKLAFSSAFVLALLFLSMILGSNGFPLRMRYSTLLEALTIPIWAMLIFEVYSALRSKWNTKVGSIVIGILLAALFINGGGLLRIYQYHGGSASSIDGTNHYRNRKAYDYLTRKLKPGDVVMMDRFYYNNEMYGYQWPEFQWLKANQTLTDKSLSIGAQMPDIDHGWMVLYPEAFMTNFEFVLEDFDSGAFHFEYHGKFEETYIWEWTKR